MFSARFTRKDNFTPVVGAHIARPRNLREFCGTTQRLFPTPIGAIHESPEQVPVSHKPNGRALTLVGAGCGSPVETSAYGSMQKHRPSRQVRPSMPARARLDYTQPNGGGKPPPYRLFNLPYAM